jgi:amidase
VALTETHTLAKFTPANPSSTSGTTRAKFSRLSAPVIEVDFPVVTKFEAPDSSRSGSPVEESITPPHHNEIDMCQLMAYTWYDFLAANGDTKVATSLSQIHSATIFPRPKNSIPDKYDTNDPLVRHTDVVAHITPDRPSTYSIPNLGPALQNLENKREDTSESWLVDLGLDAVVCPCNGDVGHSDADVNEQSAADAWRNGVLYSNGNYGIKQLGIPTVSVPMDIMVDIGMPVNLTFAGKAYGDNKLLEYAWAFKKGRSFRRAPRRTPELTSDRIEVGMGEREVRGKAPGLSVSAVVLSEGEAKRVRVEGTCDLDDVEMMQVFIDGDEG